MTQEHAVIIAGELGLDAGQVRRTAALLAEGATVPFIARYRKEVTGTLDEVAVTAIRDRVEQLAELDKRRDAILKSLVERELLTPELERKIRGAENLARLEDLYLPFRPKRKTRASVAREKGLDPLAELLFDQNPATRPEEEAARFIDPEKGVAGAEEALAGARDIIAEKVNEDEAARAKMRQLFMESSVLRSRVITGKEEEAAKYKDYFDWSEPARTAPSHRVLAIRRGEKEKLLLFDVAPDEGEATRILERLFVKGSCPAAEQVRQAVQDGYKRLLAPAMESETRLALKTRADEEAIRVFMRNLKELLLSPPLGQKRVLALDPGFRTGCKVVCLDAQGKLLHHDVVHVVGSERQVHDAGQKIKALCEAYRMEAVAVGNGTASRETEAFLRNLGLPPSIAVVSVNESGASVYSASETAREEFPDQDVTVRGSVSIGRRLQDPLAELVKIDPKSIGVGQYQHDVDQAGLRRSLDDVVMSCVNSVGVEVNTASRQLLTYVSGLGPTLAGNIVAFRDENGPFPSRAALKKVPRLGPKAFEQAAGFLRIRGGKNPLDASAVHPESYGVVNVMARDQGCAVADLIKEPARREGLDLSKYVTDTVGLPTLNDILNELAKPGRDPREQFEAFHFAEGVEKIEDVKPGMTLPGIVTNVTAFGAFVDIGVHQDGLVHVSQLADRFVKDPSDVVKVHQRVSVRVLDVDLARGRVALSMKSDAGKSGPPRKQGAAKGAQSSAAAAAKPEGKKPPQAGWFAELVDEARKPRKGPR